MPYLFKLGMNWLSPCHSRTDSLFEQHCCSQAGIRIAESVEDLAN